MITVAAREHGTFSNDCTQIATWLDGCTGGCEDGWMNIRMFFVFLHVWKVFQIFKGKLFWKINPSIFGKKTCS